MSADNQDDAGQPSQASNSPPTPVQTQLVARDPKTGQLLKGSRLNPRGSKEGGRANEIRNLLLNAESDEDVLDVWAAVRKKAKAGDYNMAKLYLERLLGKEVQPILTNLPHGAADEDRNALVTLLASNPALISAINEAARQQYVGHPPSLPLREVPQRQVRDVRELSSHTPTAPPIGSTDEPGTPG